MEQSDEEVLKEREYLKVECKFSRSDRWMRATAEYETFKSAAQAGSIFLNQEDVEDYRILKIEKKETIIHS